MNQTPEIAPKCPECGLQPIRMNVTQFNFSTGLIMAAASCTQCGHILCTFPAGFQQSKIVAPN